MKKNKILVTGGTGYIGSHTVVALMEAGFEVVVIDNLSNSEIGMLERIRKITGSIPEFHELDLRNGQLVADFFKKHSDIEGIIHFAAFKAVGESVSKPLKYYYNNMNALMHLLQHIPEGIKSFIFSSSCTVYGEPEKSPVNENTPVQLPESPYGNTKKIGEEILTDHSRAAGLPVISLRYFNPIGAHESANIGEMPTGIPDNLIPYVTQTAIGKRKEITVYGNDYPTPDGTCIRDYIHIMDLAEAHVTALKRNLNAQHKKQFEVFNLGTGKGYSVMEVLNTFMEVNKVDLPYKIGSRRAGDVIQIWADPAKANNELGWKADRDLKDMLATAWKWEQNIKSKSEESHV